MMPVKHDPFPEFRPGMIAVTNDGARIAIWPNETDDERCFTGQLLEPGASIAKARTVNLSVFWDRSKVHHIEPPTDEDQKLSLTRLSDLV